MILLKGAHQTGKTSLVARALARSRTGGKKAVVTDIQKLRLDRLGEIEAFLHALACSLADSLELDLGVETAWESRRLASSNFERFLKRALGGKRERVVWAIDEVDRIFPYPYASEFFGLLRAWHNESALNPGSHWQRLTILIAYATEAHLFIADANQSTFNVGSKFELLDFTREQVAALNTLYGSPADERGISELHTLLNGHPELPQRALYELATHRHSLSDLAKSATNEVGPFSDHLRHLLVSLEERPELLNSVREMLRGAATMPTDHFYRLRAFGILGGDRARDATPRSAGSSPS